MELNSGRGAVRQFLGTNVPVLPGLSGRSGLFVRLSESCRRAAGGRVSNGRRIAYPVLLALLATGVRAPLPRGLHAQSGAPLSVDHWAPDFLDALDLLGVGEGWSVDLGTVPRSVYSEEFGRIHRWRSDTVPVGVGAWIERFLLERGRPTGVGSDDGSRRKFELETSVGVRDARSSLLPGRGTFVRATGALFPVRGITIWAEGDDGYADPFEGFRSGGVSLGAGPFAVLIGRLPLRAASPARESGLLSGAVPTDAVYMVSRRPVRIPGLEWALGKVAWQFSVGPWAGIEDRDAGWMALGTATAEPMPFLRLGVTRVVRFGGPEVEGVTARRLFKTLVFAQNEPTNWDDNTLQLHARARFEVAGRPISIYGVLGSEAPFSSFWRDPGVQVGATSASAGAWGLVRLRYEYSAYGGRGRWCPGCAFAGGEEGDPPLSDWFLHSRLEPFRREGIPLGHSIGGYGAQHWIEFDFWDPTGMLRTKSWSFFEIRESKNLLEGRWPGKRRGLGVEVGWAWRPGVEISGSSLWTHRTTKGSEFGFTVMSTVIFGGEHP